MVYDLIIIGAGPAGLAAGIYAVERRLNTLILEGNKPGGQLTTIYPNKKIYDYPGIEEISGAQLAKCLVDHAQLLGCRIQHHYQVEKLNKQDDIFWVQSSHGLFKAKSIIIASGMGIFKPRHLEVPGEVKLSGKGVFHQELPDFYQRGKRGVFIGGGDTALELALLLSTRCDVSIIHRRDQFRALEANVEKVKHSNIRLYLDSEVKEFLGKNHLEAVYIKNNKTGAEKILPVDFAVVCIGVFLDASLIGNLGVLVDKQAIVTDENMQSSIAGLFAAGDVAVPAGKYKRITIAQGQAAQAVQGVYEYVKKPYWVNK